MRPHPALVELAAGRDLPHVDDVGSLVASAVEHRMHGLLWTCVQCGEVDVGRWGSVLAQEDVVCRARHELLWDAIGRYRVRADELGVGVAVLKGVPCEARWYERTGERPCRDVDLLFSPCDVNQIERVVRSFEPSRPRPDLIEGLARTGLVQAVTLGSDDVTVDLHFDPLRIGVPSRTFRSMWDRMVPFTLDDGSHIRVPDPETALVLFLVHMNRDRFSTLLAYADVARVIGRERIDWAAFARIVRAEGLDVPVGCALDAVSATLRLAIPVSPARPTARRVVWNALWRPSTRLHGRSGMVRRVRRTRALPFLARGRMREATITTMRRLFPPRSYVAFVDGERSYLEWFVRGRADAVIERRRRRARALR